MEKETLFDLKSVKAGAVIFFFAIMLSAALITTAVLPWTTYRNLESACTLSATATVAEDCTQEEDGVYYNGPVVTYHNAKTGFDYKVSAVNTVDLGKEWKEGETIDICYDEEDPSQVILKDENTAEKRCKMTIAGMSLLCVLTLGYFVYTIVLRFRVSKLKRIKVDSNILGESFEEWQAKQNQGGEENKTQETEQSEKETE